MATAAELLDQLTAAYQPLWDARATLNRIAVEAMRQIARERCPQAVTIVLDDSDQPHGRYVFSHFEDAQGEEIDPDDYLADVDDDIWRPASDLDYDEVLEANDYRIPVEPPAKAGE